MVNYFNSIYIISIHTPTRGVTEFPEAPKSSEIISIHTPTRGVTVDSDYLLTTLKISIHTPTRGVTPLDCLVSIL